MFAWHSINSYAYHTSLRCTEGNNIETRNWRVGTGGKIQCLTCWLEERPWMRAPTPVDSFLSLRRVP